jgi:fatty-acid desaturase
MSGPSILLPQDTDQHRLVSHQPPSQSKVGPTRMLAACLKAALGSPAVVERLQLWLQQHKQHHEEENERHGAGSGSHYG